MADDPIPTNIPVGPRADDADHAFRAVHPRQWTGNKPSTAAFKTTNPFSVFLKSGLSGDLDEAGRQCVALLEEGGLGNLAMQSAVVGFNCGEVRPLGYAVHVEREAHEHESHAHTYALGPDGRTVTRSQFKKMANALRDLAAKNIVRPPQDI